MTDKPENSKSIAALREANRDSAAVSTSRKPWATPQVILGTLADSELHAAGAPDGGVSFGTTLS